MFEAERIVMTDNVIIPVYSYVSKRLINPHLRGWQPNILDHHPSRFMYMLRSFDPNALAPAPAEDSAPDGLTELEVLPGEESGSVDEAEIEAAADAPETSEEPPPEEGEPR